MGNSNTVQPFHHCAVQGDLDTVHSYLESGYNINTLDPQGKSALRLALDFGQPQIFNLLFANGGRIIPSLKPHQSPLHYAVIQGQYNLVKFMLRHPQLSQFKNDQDKEKRTPLHLAVIQGDPEMVAILLKYNVDKNKRDSFGRTAADIAASTDSQHGGEILEQLMAEDLINKVSSNKYFDENSTPRLKETASTKEAVQSVEESGGDSFQLERVLKRQKVTIIPGCDLQFEDVINKGSSCVVVKGRWQGTQVAIKQFKLEYKNNEKEVQKFVKELQVLADIRHPNLLLLMGVCIDLPNLCIVTEYVPNSTLFTALHRNKNYRLTIKDRFDVAIQICRGLTYLHGFQPPIIHRDLKPENCLLDNNLSLKIADFGLARPLSRFQFEGEATTVCIGTTRFMAPELFDKDMFNSVGVEVDIWALGCILIELFSNKRPWHYISSSNSNCIYYEIFNKKPVPIPEIIPSRVRVIIESCCQYEISQRPTAIDVLSRLEALASTISTR